MLGNQKHPIKEKIMTSIGSKIKNNKDGVEEILKFLRQIYTGDEMADAFAKYVSFEKRTRKTDEKLQEFIADWEKVKQKGCYLSDMILAFKLLESSKLTEIETNLVLNWTNLKHMKKFQILDRSVWEQIRFCRED